MVQTSLRPNVHRKLLLERLEARLLFDGTVDQPLPIEPDVMVQTADAAEGEFGSSSNESIRTLADNSQTGELPTADSAQSDTLAQLSEVALHDPAADSLLESAPLQSIVAVEFRHELVFLDTSVADHAALLADLQARIGLDRELEVVLIDSAVDGVNQLTELLSGRTDLDAIHLISHGGNGSFRLGNQWITNESLPGFADQILQWGDSLTDDGDILIYGCDVAALSDGQSLVDSLAALTGADVAASTDLTGTAALGGDWNLEYSTGRIETATQVQAGAADQWVGLLAAPTIAAVYSPTFYIDSGASLTGRYVAYTITNPNAYALDDVQASIGNFTGGVVTKATNEDGVVHLGSLAAGASATAFFYVQASGVTVIPQLHTINVYSGPPGVGSLLKTQIFTMATVETTIAASANKVTTVVSGPNPASLGGLMTMTVTGDTGTMGAAKVLSFTPASYANWDANAYELLSSSITLSGPNTGTFNNTLVIPPASITSTSDTHYVVTYTFRAMAVTTAPTVVSPVGYISSGAQVKHTSTGGYINFAPIAPASNTVTLSLGVNQTNWPNAGGEATYTLTLTNSGSSAVTLDQLNVALASSPANLTYVSGTSTYRGTAISNPFISGQNLTWSGAYTVAAGSTATLVFHATAPATAGPPYTSTATGKIGSTVIDTTLSTTDNVPASTFVDVNARPTTANQTLTMNENGTLVFTAANFPYSDADGDAQQSVKIASLPGTGALRLNGVAVTANQVITLADIAAGLLVYRPVANQFASPYTSFGFQVGDGIDFSTTATMTVNVLEVTNNPPVANDDSFTTNEDTAIAISVKANDTDADSNPLTITQVNGAAIVAGGAAIAVTNGTVSLNAAGTQLTFTPSANYNGAVSYTYTISDGQGGTASATVSGTVTAVNDPPVAVNDMAATIKDTLVTTSVLANDSDSDGDPLTIASFTQPANGSVIDNGNGTLSYVPAAGFIGSDSFTYTVSDGQGGFDTATVVITVANCSCDEDALLTTGSRLASVDSTKSALLNGLLGNLLGYNVNLTVLDWNSVAQGGFGLTQFLDVLQSELNVGSTSEALSANVTLLQIVDAAASVAQADGNTALIDALNSLSPSLSGLSGTVQLGDLLQLDLAPGSLVTGQLNALDLITGSVQLFNFQNVATTPSPVTISGADLGLGGVINSVQLWAQVVEPPVIVSSECGTAFHTAAIRLKLDLDLVNQSPDTTALTSALESALGVTVNVEATATIGRLQLYADVARGEGVVSIVDALNSLVVVQAAPGVADLYLGTIDDAVFFNRSHVLDPLTDVSTTTIGALTIRVTNALSGLEIVNSSTGIEARSIAEGQAPLSSTLIFSGPFTETQTVGSSAAFIAVLVNGLVTDFDLQLNGSMGALLDPLINSVIFPALVPVVTDAVTPILTTTLTNLVDPQLKLLGVGIGEMDVTISAPAENCPPEANDDTITTSENSPVTVDVIANDADEDGNLDPSTVTIVSGPANGTVAVNPLTGEVTYTPNAYFSGSDSFSYRVSDTVGASDTALVNVTVTPVNDPPVANNDSFGTMNEDDSQAVTVKTNDSDIDGNPLTITQVDGAAIVAGGAAVSVTNGSVTLSADGNTLTFSPSANYNGPASFTYTISDGQGGTASATVSGTVTPVNDPPVAVNDSFTTNEDTSVGITVKSNDTDVDGNPLTITQVNGAAITAGGAAVAVTNGSVTLSADGNTLTFSPSANYNGPASFTYTISDGAGGTASATVSGTVNVVNGPPVAVNDTFTTTEDTAVGISVKANDSDIDGNPLSITQVNGTAITAGGAAVSVTNGTVSLNAAGTQLIFTPTANYNGPASFTYTISDGAGGTATATVSGAVGGVNDPPAAVADTNTTSENTSTSGNVLTNDSDLDGDTLTVSAVNGSLANVGAATTGSNGGSFTIQSNGSYVFSPGAAFNDLAVGESRATSVTYEVSDGNGGTASTTVTVTVTGTNDAPTSTTIAAQNNADSQAVTLNVSGSFSDPDGSDVLAFSAANLPPGLSINPTTGVITGTIASSASVTGPYSVTVTATDPSGASTSQTLTWNVTNPAPTANDDSGSTTENATATGNVLTDGTDDSDPDGDALTVSAVNGVAGNVGTSVAGSNGGSFTINSTGGYTFNPGTTFDDLAVGETRTTTVSYTITDSQGGISSATLSVTVTGTNDTPTSTAIASQSNNDSAAVTLDVSTNFADADSSDTFTFSASNLPPGLSINPTTGVITGTIAASASVGGPYSVTITGTDPHGAATAQTFIWTVSNPAPSATADTNSVSENGTASGNALTNDTDPDGDTLTVGSVNGSSSNVGNPVSGSNGGTFSVNANGGYSFSPGAAFNDLALGETRSTSVTYTATDSQGGTSTTTLTITVTGTNDTPTSTPLGAQGSTDGQIVSLNVSGSFSDSDGSDALMFSAANLPPGLSIDAATGLISGTIDHSASVGGPYTVTITATDPHGATTSQTFTWNVTNPAPNAIANTGSASENGTTSGNVLTNDSDPDGDTLTVSAVNGAAGNIGANVIGSNGGTFSIGATGAYTFNPGTAFDDLALGETRTTTVSYTASDNEGGMSTTTLTITVTGTNDGPVSTAIANQAHNDSDVVNVDLSGSFSDADGSDVLTFGATNLPPGLSIDSNTGVVTGTLDPSASAGGPYSVTVTATDPHGAITTQTFNWVVSNVSPTAFDDSNATTENSLVTGNVLANDVDPDNDVLVVAAVNGSAASVGASTAGTQGGYFTINANGSYTFIPGTDFDNLAVGETRSTTIRYTADDNNGGAVEATLTVLVTGVNDAPASTPIGTQISNDGDVVTLDVSSQFSDPDASDTFTFTATGLPAGLSIDPATGVITGTIAASASVGGPYSVTITGTDPSGAATSQTFTWNVSNPAPTAVADANSTTENATATGNVLTDGIDDNDPDGDTLVVSAVNGAAGSVGAGVTGSSGGTFNISSTGAYTFNPGSAFDDLAVGETRTTAVSYTISDGEGGTSSATVTMTVTGTNDAPNSTTIATQNGIDNTPVTVDVSGSFSDPDSTDVLTFSDGGSLPPGLSIDPNTGVITGTIDPSASTGGPFTVIITGTDASGATTSQTFTWNVTNPAPTANADTATVASGATGSGNVLTNDSDPDGDTLSVSAVNDAAGNVGASVSGSNGGTFTVNTNGGYSFDPGTAFNDLAQGETRTTTVSYTMTDSQGGFSTATVTITVVGVNEAPTSTPIAAQNGIDNTPVTLDVSGNFTDGDASDVLTFGATNLPAGLSINPTTGVITGTIDHSASVSGPYSVTVTATDPWGAVTSQTFTWNVTNPAPTAVDDSFTTTENAPASGNVLTHGTDDSDPDGDTLFVSAVNGVAGNVGAAVTGSNGGSFTIGLTGAMTFNPGTAFDDLAVGETRTTTVTYTVSDGEGGTDTATVTYTVTGTNDAPVSTLIATQTGSDSDPVTLDVSGSFSDPDGSDVLAFSDGGTLPPGLSIDPNTGVITGTIDRSASTGGPYTVTITSTDPSGAPTTQTFTWNVTNPIPTAVDDSFSTAENATTGGNVLTHGTDDSDPDGDTLFVSAVNGVAGNVSASVFGSNGGSFTIASTGAVAFNPGSAFNDLAAGETRVTAVTYTISDGEGGTDTATITVTVTGTNDAPVSTPIATQTGIDNTPVTLDLGPNFADLDSSDVLTFSDGGTLPPGLSIDPATGVITGTIDPSASVSGPYTVVITGTDPSGVSTSQTFTWNISNPAPTAVGDTNSVAENGTTSGIVIANDSDPDDDTLSVSAVNGAAGNVGSGVTGSNGGTFTINTNGGYTFNPGSAFNDLAVGETRTTSVTYTVTDNEGGSSTATVLVTVTGSNDAPVSTDIAPQNGTDNTPVALDVSGNFSDPDGTDTFTFSDGGTLPPGLSIDPATGLISGTIDPSASVGGPYTVVITGTDPSGAATLQTFVWNVTNPAPTATNDTRTGSENATLTGSVLTNDTDPDGDTLSVSAVNGAAGSVGTNVTGSSGGTFTINTNGGYSFVPGSAFDELAVGESRMTTISYTMTDGDGGFSTATVAVTVTGTNDAPTSTAIATQNGADNTPVTLDVSGHFADTDASDTLTFAATNLPPGLSINPTNGLITGTIDPSASVGGPYSVTITATDPHGGTTTQTFTWNVANPAPTATGDTAAVTENAPATGNVLTNDTDPDGDTLTVGAVNGSSGNVGAGVSGTNGGTFTINTNGSYTFVPGSDFEDLAVGETRTTTVSYTVTDGQRGTSTATVRVTVTGTNDAPTSTTIATQTSSDNTPVTLDVSGNFSDPDATDTFTFTATNLPPGLTVDPVTGNISGTVDPSASVGGPYTVVITATDPSGVPTSQTFTWNVANPAPTATNDTPASTENVSVSGNVLTNDTDPDDDALSVSAVNGVAGNVGAGVTGSNGGSFNIISTGAYTFLPGTAFDDLAVGETRVTTVSYTINDGQGGTSTATVSMTITGTNDVPVSTPISTQTATDNVSVTFDVSGYFSDPDASDVLTFSADNLPPGLSLDPATGVITGTIDHSASVGGPYSVTIFATDLSGVVTSETFVWNVANPAPTARNDNRSATESAIVAGNVLTNDTDPDSDALSVSAVNGAAGGVGTGIGGSNGGTFTIGIDGAFVFNPGTSFDDLAIGETRVTTVSYTMTDGEGGFSTATVKVTVTGMNDAPVSTLIATQNDDDNTPVTLDVYHNFADTDASDMLTFSTTNLPPGLSIDPASGLISGTIDHSASVGGPYSVSVFADDGHGGVTSQTFVWNVTNPAPTSTNDSAAVTENASASGNVLSNDTDPDSDVLTVASVNGAAANVGGGVTGTNNGTFTINADGTYTFNTLTAFDDLAAGETRVTSISYTMTDSEGGVSTSIVAVTVTGTNDAPTSTRIAAQNGTDNTPVTLDVFGHFRDKDASDVLTFSAANLPPGLSIDRATGIVSGTIDHSASVGGPYSVTITATDPHGAATSQAFRWNVANPAPVAVNDERTTTENVAISGLLLPNDSDPDGDTFSVTAVNGSTSGVGSGVQGSGGGVFLISADGSYSFDPRVAFDDLAVGESRTTSVSYTIDDSEGGTSTATATITVTGTNDVPAATAIPNHDSTGLDVVGLEVSGYFSDADTTDQLTYSADNLPPGLSIDPQAGFISGTIDPTAAANGPYSVTITVRDLHGGTASTTFVWNVVNPDVQVTVSDANATTEPGDSVVFTINYENTSLRDATGVVITQTLPPHTSFDPSTSSAAWIDNGDGTLSFAVGRVGIGDSGELFFGVIIDSSLEAGVEQTSTVSQIHDDGTHGIDLTPENNVASDITPIVAQPDYSVSIDDSRTWMLRGESIGYSILVANDGNQEGTGVVVVSYFSPEVLTNVSASHGGVVDQAVGTITWHFDSLPAGDMLALNVGGVISLNAAPEIVRFSQHIIVTDDGLNGVEPTPSNNAAVDTTRLQGFGFDTIHNLSKVDIPGMAVPPLTTKLMPLPVDPIFSGITEPGTTLVGKIYDQHGSLIGERQVMADSSGNWMMSFPNSVVLENPHRMEIQQTAALQSGGHESGFNFRRYFHPAAHSSIFFTTELTVNEVFRRSAYQMVQALHEGNQTPYGFSWFAHAYELAAASSNAGQG